MTNQNSNSAHVTNSEIQKGSGLKLFLSFFWRHPKLMTGALVLLFINSAIVLLPAIVIGRSLEILLNEGYTTQFITMASAIILLAILNYITSTLSRYYFMITAFALERDVRQDFFDNLVDSSMSFHDQNNSSRLLSLGLNEIHFMSGGAMMMSFLLQSIITAGMVLFYFTNMFGGLVVSYIAFGFILYFYLVFQYAGKINPLRIARSKSLQTLTEQSQEIFRGIQVVRSFSTQEKEIERFKLETEINSQISEKEGKLSAFYIPGLVLILITASVFTFALSLVQAGTMSVSQLVEVIGLLLIFQVLNFTIPAVILAIRAALVNADRIWAKMSSAKNLKLVENGNYKTQKDAINEIRFEGVTFAYPSYSRAAVSGVNFTISAGEKVVLLGGPGSGKSSLLKLLLGLYRPQEGVISLNGLDITELPESEIRKNIAMVEQEVFLFAGSIKENVAFANRNASDSDIYNALTIAQATEFIDNLESGVDTVIGERGVTLSGGQKQRIAIARALLADPQVLLLDDSTSAVDAKTEALISAALENLSKNRTTISVAQRLNTLILADKIIFLDKGSIIGIGTHKSLYKDSSKYREIFDLLPDSNKSQPIKSDPLVVNVDQLTKGGN